MNFRTTFAKSGGGHVHPVATPLFVTEEGAGRMVNWAALNAGLRRLQSGASDFTGPLVVTVNKEKVSNTLARVPRCSDLVHTNLGQSIRNVHVR